MFKIGDKVVYKGYNASPVCKVLDIKYHDLVGLYRYKVKIIEIDNNYPQFYKAYPLGDIFWSYSINFKAYIEEDIPEQYIQLNLFEVI